MIRQKYRSSTRRIVCGLFRISACWLRPGPTTATGGPPPPAVTVAQPIKRNIIDHDEYVGRFVAVDPVEIRARVSGYL